MKPGRNIERLVEIMAALRHPETGCPWDIEQDFSTIAPYTVEEAHEVADAIARDDMVDLREELGDLLLQVVYHARLAEEKGHFALSDVVEAITTKMIRRHPHVFGDEAARTAGVAKGFWEKIKAEEKAERAARRGEARAAPARTLDGVPAALPALDRAVRLQKKAAKVGFDWNAVDPIIAKVHEELEEVRQELAYDDPDRDRVEDEVGDVLFAVANLARHAGVDPDQALRRANAKFAGRFNAVEDRLEAEGRDAADVGLDELERLWGEVKAARRPSGS